MKLEVVVLVSDVDRAKRFYETLGFRLDIDHVASEDWMKRLGGRTNRWTLRL